MFSNPNNAMRAGWAAVAVEAFRDVCVGDPLDSPDGMKDAIGDLIADLLHLARAEGIDPQAMLHNGRMHFEAEEEEEKELNR